MTAIHGLQTAEDLAIIGWRLLGWYESHRRDLPWRCTRDPYAIWLAEIMLQQTRLDTVIAYYDRFLIRFPTLEALAEAPLGVEAVAAAVAAGSRRNCLK